MMQARRNVIALGATLLVHTVLSQNEKQCRPYKWDSGGLQQLVLDADAPVPTEGVPTIVETGKINCRYPARTADEVNYYTCTELANYYDITVDQFFFLNPSLKKDCSNIAPRTEYCVRGFIEPLRAFDGRCGPPNKNATCLGTKLPCCNAETWTCGNSTQDCAPGTCYEGQCEGSGRYSTDGFCGEAHDWRQCAGKWGNCCSFGGRCGTGDTFCGLFTCQEGDCDVWKQDKQPQGTPWTPDGTCGGPKGYRCSPTWGRCCNVNNICGEKPADCYVERGCNSRFGICATNSTSTTTTVSSTTGTRIGTTLPSLSTPSTSPTGPAFVPGGGKFQLLGCYREPAGSRAFADLVPDDVMTVERCLSTAAGQTFAGVEFGRECWMGKALRAPLTKVDESNCKMPCPGNGQQYCGSGNHIVLYSTGAKPAVPRHPSAVGTSSFFGCMTEVVGGRALSASTSATDDMTLERCSTWCMTGGKVWKYFGVEYARECFCGDSISQGSTLTAETDCSMPCAGDGTQLCGGGDRLSVYTRSS